MEPKDSIKLDIGRLDKAYPEEKVLSENGLYTYHPDVSLVNNINKGRARNII